MAIAPAIMAVFDANREPITASRDRLLLLVVFAGATGLLLSTESSRSEWTLVLTLACLYPILLLFITRMTQRWGAVALAAIAILTFWHTSRGVGPFANNPTGALIFLLAASVWTLMLGAVLDRSRALATEAAVNEARQRFLLELAAEIGWEADAKGSRFHVTALRPEDRIKAIARYGSERWLERIHPIDRPLVEKRWADGVNGGGRIVIEYRDQGALADGSDWRWIRLLAAPLRDKRGRVLKWVGMDADITHSKEAEAALHAKTEQLEALITTAPLGVAYFDRELRWVKVNQVMAAVNGFPEEAHFGRRIDELLPEIALSVIPALRDVFETGEPVGNVEVSGSTPSAPDVRRYWLCGYFPVRNMAGDIELVGAWVTEITSRKRAEQALVDSDRRKDEFLATLGHELRNPLAPLVNATEIMQRSTPGSDIAKQAQQIIERQTGHMARLVDDLLDLSRVRMGKLHLRLELVSLGPILSEAAEVIAPQCEARRIALSIALPVTSVTVRVDAHRIRQLVMNLLTNACKYTESGGRIDVRLDHKDGNTLIVVADNGIGIEPERLEGIFELFAQTHDAVQRSQGGLGIGLALCRSIVVAHGGTIEVESDGLGRGATFTVKLPDTLLHG